MSWKRWAARLLIGALAIPVFGGCKQQLFLEPGDYSDAVRSGLPKALETNPHAAIVPEVVDPHSSPATVLDPSRPARYITLKECIAVALEQGNVGSQSQTQFGLKIEVNNSFTGQGVGGTDAIRAYALDPSVSGANIERSLSKFDARWITSMQWQKNDNPVAAQFVSFQSQNDQANFNSTLVKALPTGGLAGITVGMNYAKFTNIPASQQNSFVNPNYTPQLQFVFEQPLLQLFGVEVNQLSSTIGQSLLINGFTQSGGQGVEGILLTRIRYDQSRAEFERIVNHMLVNVEAAYWNLYASYYTLYAQEEGLRQSFAGYRFTEARVGVGTDPPQQLNQSRAQFELFRAQVYRARGQVLEAERQLRGLMGLRSDDGSRLVPVDKPNLAPYRPDFYEAANEAIANRPELRLTRQEVKARQFDLTLQRSLRKPDLRFYSSYNIQGIGTRLDGSELVGVNNTLPGNALSSFSNNQFNSWTMGLRLNMPIGFRDANAQVRQANLNLTRSYYQLRDSELKTLEYLTSRYRRVVETYTVLPPLRSRREQLQIYVEKTREVIKIGKWTSQDYFNLLQVQRDLADSINQEFRAIADYNTALAELEFAKGTILRYNNISLAEGQLPPWVTKRAADHEAERAAALKLRERPASEVAPTGSVGGRPVGPAIGSPFVNDLPAITDMPPPGPETLDKLPSDPDPGHNPSTEPMVEPKRLPQPKPADRGPDASTAQPTPRAFTPAMPPAIGNSPSAAPVSTGMPSMPLAPSAPGVAVDPASPSVSGTPGTIEVPAEGSVTIPRARPIRSRFTPNTASAPMPPATVAPGASVGSAPVAPPVPTPGIGTGIPPSFPTTGVPTYSAVPVNSTENR